jgi:hypothetical protein
VRGVPRQEPASPGDPVACCRRGLLANRGTASVWPLSSAPPPPTTSSASSRSRRMTAEGWLDCSSPIRRCGISLLAPRYAGYSVVVCNTIIWWAVSGSIQTCWMRKTRLRSTPRLRTCSSIRTSESMTSVMCGSATAVLPGQAASALAHVRRGRRPGARGPAGTRAQR